MNISYGSRVFYINRDDELLWRGDSAAVLEMEWNRIAALIDSEPHRYRAWRWERGTRTECTDALERQRLHLNGLELSAPLRRSIVLGLALLLVSFVASMGWHGLSPFLSVVLLLAISGGLAIERVHTKQLRRWYRYHLLDARGRLYWAANEAGAIAMKLSGTDTNNFFVYDTRSGERIPWEIALRGGWLERQIKHW